MHHNSNHIDNTMHNNSNMHHMHNNNMHHNSNHIDNNMHNNGNRHHNTMTIIII